MNEILLPPAVLIVWTLVMAFWMLVDRASLFKKHSIDITKHRGARGSDLQKVLPEGSDWPGHNYNHLMEQPTIFYAAVIILALSGYATLDLWLAWVYVVLRIVHSVYQAKFNTLQVRGSLFGIMTLVLVILAVRTVLAVLGSSA